MKWVWSQCVKEPIFLEVRVTTQGCLDSYVLKRMLLNGLHEIKTEAPYMVNCVRKISGSMEKTVFYTNKSLSFLSRNEMGGQQRWEEVKAVILQSRLIIKILVEHNIRGN